MLSMEYVQDSLTIVIYRLPLSLLAYYRKREEAPLAGARDDSHLMRLDMEEAAIRVRVNLNS